MRRREPRKPGVLQHQGSTWNRLAIYLVFKGNCLKAMKHCAGVLDHEIGVCAERFAMFTDRFDTPWMLKFEGDSAER